jgi:hypothetical protein
VADTEREHIASVDCWCKPRVEHYGASMPATGRMAKQKPQVICDGCHQEFPAKDMANAPPRLCLDCFNGWTDATRPLGERV